MSKINFVTGKEILIEIQKSKNSYCWFEDPTNTDFKYITRSAINQQMIALLEVGDIIRVMDDTHIPTVTRRDTKTGQPKDVPVFVNFPPFKHYTWDGTSLRETARSHWQGSLSNGQFCMTHGNITNRMAEIMLLLVNRYGTKSNWRGYSYIEEMKGQAIINLTRNGLKYDESKANGNQTFAYLTRIMQNSFQYVLKKEKEQDAVSDDIAHEAGSKQLTYSQQAQIDIDRYHGKLHTSYSSLRGERPKKVATPKEVIEKTYFSSIFSF